MSPDADTLHTGIMPDAEPPIRFSDRGELFGLLVKNAFLTLITLGIYRFWARAALRRYWWRSIELGGDRFEYTGTGLELFIGFLMFLGLMLPIGVAYGLAALVQVSSPVWGGVMRAAITLVFVVLVQIVTFRARRYRLSRTLWRGIRASQGGSSLAYLRLVVGWSLLTIITLGIAVPWARNAATRYLMNRTSLGDLEARFDGKGRDLLGAWLVPILFLVGGVGSFFLLNLDKFAKGVQPDLSGDIWLVSVGYLGFFIGLLVYFFIEARYVIRHTRFGEMALGSDLPVGQLTRRTVLFGFVAFLVLIVAFVLVVATYAGAAGKAGAAVRPGVILFAIVVFFLALSLINLLRILWLDRLIVRRVCETMTLSNPDHLNRIGQSTAPVPAAGEGMADAFDIGAF